MKLLREPLVHFLAFGALLFLLFSFFSDTSEIASNEIVITQGHVQRLVEAWKLTWRRVPTQREMEGLINDYITEEVFYREALTLGLDKDDTMIRRRLRQKMEFISQDLASQLEPSEEELHAYLGEKADYFRLEPRLSFAHIYLNPDRRRGSVQADAERLLARVSKAGSKLNPAGLGDPFPLPHDWESQTQSQVAKIFGAEFSNQLLELEQGPWVGPVESGYGFHLVKISERVEGRLPELSEVLETVRREWTAARQREINNDFISRLREKYTITLDLPEPVDEPSSAAEAE